MEDQAMPTTEDQKPEGEMPAAEGMDSEMPAVEGEKTEEATPAA